MVLGPGSYSRQGLYRQCGGPHGGEVEPPACRDPERTKAARLSGQQRRIRHAPDALPGLKRGNARPALGGGSSGPHLSLRRFLSISPRSCPGSSLLADPARIAQRSTPTNRKTALRPLREEGGQNL